MSLSDKIHLSGRKPLLLHVFPSFEVGGTQRRFAGLLNASSGHFDHVIIALDGNIDALALIDPELRPRVHSANIPKRATFKALAACRRVLGHIKPDLLVTYNWGSMEWVLANMLFYGLPNIQIQDGFGLEEFDAQKTRRRLARRFLYQNCRQVIVPSKTLEQLASRSWGLTANKIRYIPNGIDIGRFQQAKDPDIMARHKLLSTDRIVGTVAALRPEKNLGRLIEAFYMASKNIPDAKLLIVGDGPARPALEMLVARTQMQDQVIFLGHQRRPEKFYPLFDVFALSSDTEQMPLSVIEAMAAGQPIVSTDVGDIKHMVSAKNAPFIQGRSEEELAKSLRTLLLNKDLAKQIGTENFEKARSKYSQLAMVTVYEISYHQALQ